MAVHNTLTGSELHEPKGLDTLTGGASDVGKVTVSDGAGSSTARKLLPSELDPTEIQSRMGIWDYNDLATQSTPIVLTSAGTYFKMTNDELGPATIKTHKLPEVADLWLEATDQFDFSGLSLGDVVDIRFDLEVTTTGANHEITMQLDVGIGDPSQYQLIIQRENFKNAGTFPVVFMFSLYMGDDHTLNDPSELQIKSDTGTTDSIKVNGWFMEATIRSNY